MACFQHFSSRDTVRTRRPPRLALHADMEQDYHGQFTFPDFPSCAQPSPPSGRKDLGGSSSNTKHDILLYVHEAPEWDISGLKVPPTSPRMAHGARQSKETDPTAQLTAAVSGPTLSRSSFKLDFRDKEEAVPFFLSKQGVPELSRDCPLLEGQLWELCSASEKEEDLEVTTPTRRSISLFRRANPNSKAMSSREPRPSRRKSKSGEDVPRSCSSPSASSFSFSTTPSSRTPSSSSSLTRSLSTDSSASSPRTVPKVGGGPMQSPRPAGVQLRSAEPVSKAQLVKIQPTAVSAVSYISSFSHHRQQVARAEEEERVELRRMASDGSDKVSKENQHPGMLTRQVSQTAVALSSEGERPASARGKLLLPPLIIASSSQEEPESLAVTPGGTHWCEDIPSPQDEEDPRVLCA